MKLRIAVNNGCVNKTNPEQVAADWLNIEDTIHWLERWVKAGYGWCATHFADHYRLAVNCRGSNLIVADIDGDTTLARFWTSETVKQWCVATYTSASHSEQEHRFRALFPCQIQLETSAQHKAAYWAITDRIREELGLERLRDNCGQKPERLWYGNKKAIFHFNEVIEDAVIPDFFLEGLQVEEQFEFEKVDVQQIDIDRCRWLLKHAIAPSNDGEYEEVYVPVMAACASVGEEIFNDWVDWVLRGHHGHKRENTQPFKWRGLGTRSGHTKLYAMAKAQDPEWTSRLPDDLKFKPAIAPGYSSVDPDINYSALSDQTRSSIGSVPSADNEPEPEPDVQNLPARRGRPRRNASDMAEERVNDIETVKQYLTDLRRNSLTRQIEYIEKGKVQILEGDALEVMTNKFAFEHGVFIPEARIKNAITFVVSNNSYCPIRNYLELCKDVTPTDDWDTLGQVYLNNPSPLATLVLQRLLIGACARALNPGAPMSWIPILVGAQGAGKSMFARSLVPDDLFSEMSVPLETLMKEMYRLHCAWVLELPEVDVFFQRKNIEHFKNLITTRRDEVRFPYDRLPTQLSRRFVMIGTTNRSQFLIDSTGNRRFIPLEIAPGFQIPWKYLAENRMSLWSAALRDYHKGAQYEFNSGEIAEHSEHISEFGEEDPWLDEIREFVADKEVITARYIIKACLGQEIGHQNTQQMSRRIGELLGQLGWRRSGWGTIPGSGMKRGRVWRRGWKATPIEEPEDNF